MAARVSPEKSGRSDWKRCKFPRREHSNRTHANWDRCRSRIPAGLDISHDVPPRIVEIGRRFRGSPVGGIATASFGSRSDSQKAVVSAMPRLAPHCNAIGPKEAISENIWRFRMTATHDSPSKQFRCRLNSSGSILEFLIIRIFEIEL